MSGHRRAVPGATGLRSPLLIRQVTGAFLLAVLAPLAGRAAPAAPVGDPDWHIPRQADFRTAPVAHPDYQHLLAAREQYAAIVAAGGWPELSPGPELRPGARDARVATLRARLRASGDYQAEMGADPWYFEPGLGEAVAAFQARHGLPVTGWPDSRTVEAANVSAADRLAQIEVTLERWRWLPRDLGERHVWANVPFTTLSVVASGKPVLSMATVVGHPSRATPSLRSEIRQVVFQPTWSVPRSIAVADLLPLQRADPTFLSRQRIRVLQGERVVDPGRVPWDQLSAEYFPYRLVQEPWAGNSLGRIKFVMDNPFDIYLHDTPARGFFGLSNRTLSSGCLRLAEPVALAELLLGLDRDWNPDHTAEQLARPETRYLSLRERLPIYVVYLTATATADGSVHFRRDIYGRDARLLATLRGAP